MLCELRLSIRWIALAAMALVANCSQGLTPSHDSGNSSASTASQFHCNATSNDAALKLAGSEPEVLLIQRDRREVWYVGTLSRDGVGRALQSLTKSEYQTVRVTSYGGDIDAALWLALAAQEQGIRIIVDDVCWSACHFLLISNATAACTDTLVALHHPFFDPNHLEFVPPSQGDAAATMQLQYMNATMRVLDPNGERYRKIAKCMIDMVRPYEASTSASLGDKNPMADESHEDRPEWWSPDLEELRQLGLPFHLVEGTSEFLDDGDARYRRLASVLGESITTDFCTN